tara:strand:- start:125 stop:1294 length:1170 start_codon:yes stop_codon:yes gene_type:complete
MNNKTNLFKLLMFFGTALFIYGLLIIFDYFFHLHQYKSYKLSNEVITDRKQNEDRKYLKEAKENGYEFIIYPYLYANNNNLRKFSKKLDIIPISGQPNTKVYYCNEGYGLIKFKTDRLGFRNNDLVWNKINDLEKKIIFIGDSFTQGACVKENENISSHFKEYVTYNLGLDGNNPAIYSALSRIFIPKIKPDFVVQLFYVNDFTEDNGDFFEKNLKIKDLEKRYLSNQSEIELSIEILNSINFAKKIINDISLPLPGERPNVFIRGMRYLSLPTMRMYISLIYNKYFFKLSSTTKNSINTLKQTCIDFNCEPIIGFITNSSYWEPNPLTNTFRKELKDYTTKVNVNFIDFTEEINSFGNLAYAPKGTHMSPAGYKIIADKIKKTLSDLD